MSTPTPSIPGVDRDALAGAIRRELACSAAVSYRAADAVLAHIAAHHECACDREHADEWVEVDGSVAADLPRGVRVRHEWVLGDAAISPLPRTFVHRDDLPDPDADLVERMAEASFCVGDLTRGDWQAADEDIKEKWRRWSRAALAAYRKGER